MTTEFQRVDILKEINEGTSDRGVNFFNNLEGKLPGGYWVRVVGAKPKSVIPGGGSYSKAVGLTVGQFIEEFVSAVKEAGYTTEAVIESRRSSESARFLDKRDDEAYQDFLNIQRDIYLIMRLRGFSHKELVT